MRRFATGREPTGGGLFDAVLKLRGLLVCGHEIGRILDEGLPGRINLRMGRGLDGDVADEGMPRAARRAMRCEAEAVA